MMRVSSDNLRITAVIFITAYSIMPFLAVVVSVYLTTYFYMGLSLLLLILIVMEKKKESFDEVFSNIGPFLAYGILTYFTQTDGIVLWGYQLMIFLMPIIVGAYIICYHKNECNNYSRVIVLCIIITCITTTVGLESNPGAARWLAIVQDSSDSRLIMYSWQNIGGYEFIYTMVLVYPLLILAFKKRKISLFKTIIITLLIFSCLVLAEYTIALILFVATTILFFMKKDLKIKDISIFLVITILLMLIFSNAVSNILTIIADNIESNTISERLNDLAGGTLGLQKSNDNRLDLYLTSINTFLKHPLGTFSSSLRGIGGHSFILDAIARYGILGILVLIYMYRKIYFLFFSKYREETDFGYVIWIFAQAVLLSIVNTGIWVNVLAFYVPVILCVLYGGSEDEKNSLDSKCIT